MRPTEVIVSYGPQNAFQDFLLKTLREREVAARVVAFSDLDPSQRGAYSESDEYDAYVIAVPLAYAEVAGEIVQHTVFECKICLNCETYIPPGGIACLKCGSPADARSPAEIRVHYQAEWMKHDTGTAGEQT